MLAGGELNVLVVDDDPNLRDLYGKALAEAGHAVRAEADAAGGIAALKEGRFDLLLLDIRLGRDHGLDVLREVSRRGLGTRTLVVTGTGDFTRGEIIDMAPDIAGVLRKPVDIERLVGAAEAALGGDLRELRAAARQPLA